MKRTSTIKITIALAAVMLLATACRTETYTFNSRIKDSSVRCSLHGNYVAHLKSPGSVSFDCGFGYTGRSEHPYLMIWISGCSKRVNAGNGSRYRATLECLGDGISSVHLQLCQTHGGLLPDDCTDRTRVVKWA